MEYRLDTSQLLDFSPLSASMSYDARKTIPEENGE